MLNRLCSLIKGLWGNKKGQTARNNKLSYRVVPTEEISNKIILYFKYIYDKLVMNHPKPIRCNYAFVSITAPLTSHVVPDTVLHVLGFLMQQP